MATEVKWLPMAGITLFGRIFVRDLSDTLVIHHEAIHARQQHEHPLWFWLSYLFLLPVLWNPYRARWEAEAYAVQAKAGVPVESLAAYLAGPSYGWCCRKATAEKLIREYL